MVTDRDMKLVRWIGRHGAVQTAHLMARYGMGRTATYRRVHELVAYGLVRRHRVLYNDGGLLTATADGLRCAGLEPLKPARVSLAQLPHTIVSATLAAMLEPRLVDTTLLSDREHRAAETAAGQPIASAILGPPRDDRSRLHRPDFALVGADGENVIAIEVELTLKTKARLERILRGYLRNQNVSRIWYYAPTNIGEAVRRAARAVGAEGVLELAPLPAADASISRGRP